VHVEKKTHKNLDTYASFWVGRAGRKCPPPVFFISNYSFFLATDLNKDKQKNWDDSGE